MPLQAGLRFSPLLGHSLAPQGAASWNAACSGSQEHPPRWLPGCSLGVAQTLLSAAGDLPAAAHRPPGSWWELGRHLAWNEAPVWEQGCTGREEAKRGQSMKNTNKRGILFPENVPFV